MVVLVDIPLDDNDDNNNREWCGEIYWRQKNDTTNLGILITNSKNWGPRETSNRNFEIPFCWHRDPRLVPENLDLKFLFDVLRESGILKFPKKWISSQKMKFDPSYVNGLTEFNSWVRQQVNKLHA